MATKSCERCDGLGMYAYKHVAGGVCFACGRLPSGAEASSAFLATARERAIGKLLGLISRAKQEAADGTLREWVKDVAEEGVPIAAIVASAPADVAARARAAFARLGVAA